MDVKKKRPRREKPATTKPRDAIVVEHILNQMGAEHFEPRVVNQGLEFIYRYVGDVLEEAKVYQRHRIGYDVANNEGGESLVDGGDGGDAMMMNLEEMKKNSVSVKDVRLASRVILAREFAANDAMESAESLQKACVKLNEKPMPKLLERPGIRVPQDDNLLNENYEIGPRRGKEGEAQMRVEQKPGAQGAPATLGHLPMGLHLPERALLGLRPEHIEPCAAHEAIAEIEVRLVEALGADCLGLAYLEEGIALRRAGITAPILILGGLLGRQIPLFLEHDLILTASSLDKLEAIPGFRTDLSVDELRRTLADVGCFISGQTGELAPADRVLYALRNETCTVPSIPLITASILSKKLAEGLDRLVLDVKWGTGAFMKTASDARTLADSLVRVGCAAGVETTAVLTETNAPLGRTVGNALEVEEAIACLQGSAEPALSHQPSISCSTFFSALSSSSLIALALLCCAPLAQFVGERQNSVDIRPAV